MVDAKGMPKSMCVAWFSPRLILSRIAAQEASLEIVDSMPYFLNSPNSCAITIDEQSVKAMMPIRMLGRLRTVRGVRAADPALWHSGQQDTQRAARQF